MKMLGVSHGFLHVLGYEQEDGIMLTRIMPGVTFTMLPHSASYWHSNYHAAFMTALKADSCVPV